jgi:hypothetical protein
MLRGIRSSESPNPELRIKRNHELRTRYGKSLCTVPVSHVANWSVDGGRREEILIARREETSQRFVSIVSVGWGGWHGVGWNASVGVILCIKRVTFTSAVSDEIIR